MNILLVEDDYFLGRSIAQLIEKAGQHRVRLTHKAADVFKYAQSGSIELVVMDVNLPGTFWQGKEVTGVELSRLLKQQFQQRPELERLPIVLLISNAKDDTHHSRLLSEALADGIYPKPIADAHDFLALLEAVSAQQDLHRLAASAS